MCFCCTVYFTWSCVNFVNCVLIGKRRRNPKCILTQENKKINFSVEIKGFHLGLFMDIYVIDSFISLLFLESERKEKQSKPGLPCLLAKGLCNSVPGNVVFTYTGNYFP